MVKDQGQTAGLYTNAFWPHSLKIAKFNTENALREWMFSIDFQVTWSKVKLKLLVLILSAVYSIFYDALISFGIKNVKLWIKVKLLMQHLKNSWTLTSI